MSVRWYWLFVAAVVGFVLSTVLRCCEKVPQASTKSVTTKERDTSRTIRPEVERKEDRILARRRPQVEADIDRFGEIDSADFVGPRALVPVVDSLRITQDRDTVDVWHSWPQGTFAYEWRRPRDTTETRIREKDSLYVESVRLVPDRKKFGIGPYVGYGYDPFLGAWRATVGVSIGWHLFEWE